MTKQEQVVLVFEEDPWVKELTRDVLELRGHTVLTAETGGDALMLCSQRGKEISMVLLDTSKTASEPAEDLYEKILKINPDVKVIITSIYGHERLASTALGRNAAGFLKKPYRIADLLQMLEKVQITQ